MTINANNKTNILVDVLDDYMTFPQDKTSLRPDIITATSSDSVLLPVRNINFGDTWAGRRTITLSPEASNPEPPR